MRKGAIVTSRKDLLSVDEYRADRGSEEERLTLEIRMAVAVAVSMAVEKSRDNPQVGWVPSERPAHRSVPRLPGVVARWRTGQWTFKAERKRGPFSRRMPLQIEYERLERSYNTDRWRAGLERLLAQRRGAQAMRHAGIETKKLLFQIVEELHRGRPNLPSHKLAANVRQLQPKYSLGHVRRVLADLPGRKYRK
jgi:hypothetical protein